MSSQTKSTRPSKRSADEAKDPAPGNGIAGTLPEDFPDEPIRLDMTFNVYPAGRIGHEELDLGTDDVLAMYRNMLLQRRFEERAAQMYGKQKIAGFLHLYIGQEAISTGTAAAIRLGHDSVITAYRDHGLGLALGMSANECMAEMFGKVGGCSRGKGGSMHFFSREKRLFGGHGIVGAHVPLAIGIAFAHKYKEDGGVCLGFYGDGAVGQGAVHEASNLAGLYELPCILVIENNQYAMGTAVHRAFAETEFTKHAAGYDLPASLVNGMDVFAVTKAMRDHAEMARNGQPSLLEMRTYRYRGHSMSDPQKYRTKDELDRKKDQDPVIRMKAYILEHEVSDDAQLDAIDEDVKNEVKASVDFAESSPAPDLEAIYENIYEEDDYPYLA
jgi:pyruvate dehydrogenase E1 component alpha subunit